MNVSGELFDYSLESSIYLRRPVSPQLIVSFTLSFLQDDSY